MINPLHLDFESRGRVSLGGSLSAGLHNYVIDKDTQPLMLAWAYGEAPVELWEIGAENMPDNLRKGFEDSGQILVAWNSSFERYVLKYKLGIDIPIERWLDPQASARYLSLPADLETVGRILGLPNEYAKDECGKELIKLFCEPHPTKKKGEEQKEYFNDKNSHPKEWQKFCDYCRQDVRSEREIMRRLTLLKVFPLPEFEQTVWYFDQKVNDRGVPVDRKFVENALSLGERAKKEAIAEMQQLTGLEKANSPTKLLAWANERGYEPNSLRKETIKAELASNTEVDSICRTALEKRLSAGSTTYTKLKAVLRRLSPDDRLRNQFIYMGSSRCGRWAGTGVQLHNLSRSGMVGSHNFEDLKIVDDARQMVYNNDYEGIKLKYGSVLLAIKNLIRTSFSCEKLKDKKFCVADLAGIETRVGAWVSGCEPLMGVFKKGLDPYIDFGVKITGIPYLKLEADLKSMISEVKSAAKAVRQLSKPVVLGCFAADTPILTQRGWVPIIEVKLSDELFDGVEWARHDGVLDKGIRNVIYLNGIKVTPEHKILVHESDWRTAWDVRQNFRLEAQAINLAIGLLSRVKLKIKNITMSAVVQDAAYENRLLNKIWREGKQRLVPNVQVINGKKKKNGVYVRFGQYPRKVIDWLANRYYAILSRCRGVGYGAYRYAGRGFNANFSTFIVLSDIVLLLKISINKAIKSTEKIMMGTILSGIFDSSFLPLITRTKKIIAISFIRIKNILQQIFGNNTPLDIEMSEILPGKLERGFLLKELSPNNQNVEVRTYDILNCGPRNRFMILTDKGPMIAHNCIYQLGGGDWYTNKYEDRVKGGLWGYAESYGVKMEQARAHELVRIFRDSYPEIVKFWYDLERAVKDVLKEGTTKVKRELGPNGCIKIDKLIMRRKLEDGEIVRNILRIRLPSGRYLHYMDASLQEVKMPWVDAAGREVYRETLVYSGVDQETKQWKHGVTSRGGKLCENIVQAIARDILAQKMLQIEEARIEICAHVHDEAIGETISGPFGPGVKDMIEIMSQPIGWASDLLLGADGFDGSFYHK